MAFSQLAGLQEMSHMTGNVPGVAREVPWMAMGVAGMSLEGAGGLLTHRSQPRG